MNGEVALRSPDSSDARSRRPWIELANENWEFGADGLMKRCFASINDLPIKESDRKFHWPLVCTAGE